MANNYSKNIILITSAIIILLILIPTIIKVYNNYEKNAVKVTEQKIIEAAEKCIKESQCDENNISLEMLYSKNYLEEMTHPISKKIYSKESLIIKKEDKYEFVEKY